MRSSTSAPLSTDTWTACGLMSCQSANPGTGVCSGVSVAAGEGAALGAEPEVPGDASLVGVQAAIAATAASATDDRRARWRIWRATVAPGQRSIERLPTYH